MDKTNAVLHTNVSLVEVADKMLLDALSADAVAAPYILTRLSDHIALVAPGRLDTLLARLLKLRHTPKVLEG
jgi:hypothetical protein